MKFNPLDYKGQYSNDLILKRESVRRAVQVNSALSYAGQSSATMEFYAPEMWDPQSVHIECELKASTAVNNAKLTNGLPSVFNRMFFKTSLGSPMNDNTQYNAGVALKKKVTPVEKEKFDALLEGDDYTNTTDMVAYKSASNRVRVSGSTTYLQYSHKLGDTMFRNCKVLAPSFGVPLLMEIALENDIIAFEATGGSPVYVIQKMFLCYDVIYLKDGPYRSNLVKKVTSGGQIPLNILGLHMVNQTLDASAEEKIHTLKPTRSSCHGMGCFIRKNGYAGQTNNSLSDYIFNESGVIEPLSVQVTVGERKFPPAPIDNINLGSPQLLKNIQRFSHLMNGEDYNSEWRMIPALLSNGVYGNGDDSNGFYYIPFDECEEDQCGLDLSTESVQVDWKFTSNSANVKTMTYFFPYDMRLLYSNAGWEVKV